MEDGTACFDRCKTLLFSRTFTFIIFFVGCMDILLPHRSNECHIFTPSTDNNLNALQTISPPTRTPSILSRQNLKNHHQHVLCCTPQHTHFYNVLRTTCHLFYFFFSFHFNDGLVFGAPHPSRKKT